jgi:hypothetical protein
MKRRLNFTGRKRIKRDQVTINFIKHRDFIDSFNFINFDHSDLELPANACVYVEAYYRTELKRFPFGTIENFSAPQSTSLTDMAYRQNLKFRVLVVETRSKKILAVADGISPDSPSDRRPILPVEFKDLGNRVWELNFEEEEASPILLINERIPDIHNIAKRDPSFFVYVYPFVLHDILNHMVFVDGIDSITDPQIEWHHDWLDFVSGMGVQPKKCLIKDSDSHDQSEASKWIEQAVEAFSDRYQKYFQAMIMKGEENQ